MSSEPTDGEIRLYRRLDQFVSQNEIDLLMFWKTTRLCLTLEEFSELLEAINFAITDDELDLLTKDYVQFINLESLLKNVETWYKKDGSVSNFIFRQGKELEETSKSKVSKKQRDSRANTLSSYGDYGSSRMKAAQRQWKKEEKLNSTLIRAKNESDYELTIKVGEANDICKKLKNDCSFIIDSGHGEANIIELKTKTGQEVQLSRKLFEKRYEQLKISSLVRGDEVQGTLQEDLKKVLVQVMYLSGQLEEQIQLLQTKGVSH